MADKPRKAQLMNRDGTFGRPKPKPKPKRKKGGQRLQDLSRERSLKKRANKALEKLRQRQRIHEQWERRPAKKGDWQLAGKFGSVSNGPRPDNPRI